MADGLYKAAEVQGDEAAENHVPKGVSVTDERPGDALTDIDFDDGAYSEMLSGRRC